MNLPQLTRQRPQLRLRPDALLTGALPGDCERDEQRVVGRAPTAQDLESEFGLGSGQVHPTACERYDVAGHCEPFDFDSFGSGPNAKPKGAGRAGAVPGNTERGVPELGYAGLGLPGRPGSPRGAPRLWRGRESQKRVGRHPKLLGDRLEPFGADVPPRAVLDGGKLPLVPAQLGGEVNLPDAPVLARLPDAVPDAFHRQDRSPAGSGPAREKKVGIALDFSGRPGDKRGMETTMTQVHRFERAGLGKAPFRVAGSYVSKYQACHGAPIQPGTSCDYCGQGIMNVCRVLSADGREFKVGFDCARKVGDAGLRKSIAPMLRELDHARDDARIEAAREALGRDDVRAKLAAMPSPNARPNDSALDWAEWMLKHAGRAGSIRVCRLVEPTT